ncbi:AraC family transcriptional regulator [Cellulomonas sp. NS3]|uniref:AraC family transcriptional regulator n=1 Tax=Cellulomonas sp. NS3 TaxID=2973977 RepID=UPI002163EF27|nr:helix-turn-helix domain-containing protein [Cellulomonas sp. NS3]
MTRDAREVGGAWRTHQRHELPPVPADLAPWVERFWSVTWDYAEPYRQLVVPTPNVHLTFRDGRATVTGVPTTHQHRVLEGRGSVLGVAFRPGWFRPLLGRAVSTLTDTTVDAADVLRCDVPDVTDPAALAELLRSVLPPPDPRSALAADAVAAVATDPGLVTVRDLAAHLSLSTRHLQRLFAEHVGAGPKWVIRLHRLREVTVRLDAGAEVRWAALAGELGYADQAHLTRDFRAMFGESPTRYAQRY